jgi:hypothetical protein
MAESSIQIPIWDITQSRTLAFADFKPKIIDYAIAIGLSSGIGPNGVAFALMSPAKFQDYFGEAPQPRPPMGPCGGKRAEIATWTALNLLTIQQQTKLILLKTALCSAVPQELLSTMEDDQGSLRSRTPEFIFSALETQLGVLTSADLDVLQIRLKKPYDRSVPVETFVATFQATLRALARAQQPISNNMAIGILQGCFNQEWTQCWVKFAADNAVVADRTVKLLCSAIVVFSRDALPILSAQQAIGISLAQDQSALIAVLRQELDDMKALMATKSLPGPIQHNAPKANSRARAAWRDMPLKDRSFCWSCGPCGHTSTDCRSAKPGHQVAATYRNQMQSAWKAMFASRGWPTV